MKVHEAIAEAARRLEPVSATARLDSELLMALALGTSREAMLLDPAGRDAPESFDGFVRRRLAHEPVAYIAGRRAFWTIELEVGAGALIPRPDSEVLIEAALERFGEAGPATILDLGVGPGTLLLAALDQWPNARGVGVDSSPVALGYARANAERLGLAGRADLALGGWEDAGGGPFELVLCNPPYVAERAELDPQVRDWEPAEALFAGADGLDSYRRLAPLLPALVARGGIACVELGAGQAGPVAETFRKSGLKISTRADLGGVERCLVLEQA